MLENRLLDLIMCGAMLRVSILASKMKDVLTR